MMFGFKRKPTPTPTPKPKPTPPAPYSTAVGTGYVDKDGVWFADKGEADLSSARKIMSNALEKWMNETNYAGLINRKWINTTSFLSDPENVRAMAVISNTKENG